MMMPAACTPVPRTAFQLFRFAQHIAGEFATFQDLPQLLHAGDLVAAEVLLLLQAAIAIERGMQQAPQLDARAFGHQFGQAVGLGQGQVHHTGHVADAALGGHAAVGDDLRHLVLAVLLHHVVDHLLAAFVVEVGVDIGHALAVRVQEALEQQVVLDGVDVGDADAVGHRAARRTAPPGPISTPISRPWLMKSCTMRK
jgi:hypothetical protein